MNQIFQNEKEKYVFFDEAYQYQIYNQKKYEFSLSISLTNQCNLNCTNCQVFCNNKNKIIHTSLSDIKKDFFYIKNNNLLECNSITLFGGEPLLNPEIKEICQYIRKIYPNINITIFTNGLLLKKWRDKDFNLIKKLNIDFLITLYPTEESIFNTQFFEEVLKNKNIKTKIHGNRPAFCKSSFTTFNTPFQLNRYYNCPHSEPPFQLFLCENKLFKCGVCQNYPSIGIPQSNKDYLLIDSMTNEDIKNYFSKPLPACSHCGYCDIDERGYIDLYSSDEIFIWHQQKDLPSNYSNSLLDLYLNNYNYYYKCCHDCDNLIKILNNKYFLSKQRQEDYRTNVIKAYQKRFFNGLGDFFIPFNNSKELLNLISEFRIYLPQQDEYKNMNFYFISMDKNKQAKKYVYKNFVPFSIDFEGNFYFLESELNDYENSYQIFKENSYLKNKLTLKINNDIIQKMKNDTCYLKNLLFNEKEKYNEKIV